MNVSPPKVSLGKFGLHQRSKTLRVAILGQSSVGKSAMVVRFITRRYIGEYDPTLEKMYTFHTVIDNEIAFFEILDTAGQQSEKDDFGLEANIRWAEAFILMYSVTDKCSFDECYRLKFLINYNKRKKRMGYTTKDSLGEIPVLLVGNKIDQAEDRMVSQEDGEKRSKEIGCVCFHEISVKESIEQVVNVFHDTCKFWRVSYRNLSKIRRSGSDKDLESPESARCSNIVSPLTGDIVSSRCLGRQLTDEELEEHEGLGTNNMNDPDSFRKRASTDGHLQHKLWRWRYGPRSLAIANSTDTFFKSERRMSISMRGENSHC